MKLGYSERTGIEFQQSQSLMVHTFLIRFEAIFAPNQDLLLERHYLNDNVMLALNRK